MEAADQRTPREAAKAGEHVAPSFKLEFFHCVWCGVLSRQHWSQALVGSYPAQSPQPIWRCTCTNCKEASWWRSVDPEEVRGTMIFPPGKQGPAPHPDMPDDVRADYEEARSIVGSSPRGAGALARLAAQRLVDELEPGEGGLNDKIGRLVKKGLEQTVQQALDSLRVVGNNCVHDGEMVLNDDAETVIAVMECMNLVVEDRVARPSRIRKLYDGLPESARAAIERRDRRA